RADPEGTPGADPEPQGGAVQLPHGTRVPGRTGIGPAERTQPVPAAHPQPGARDCPAASSAGADGLGTADRGLEPARRWSAAALDEAAGHRKADRLSPAPRR